MKLQDVPQDNSASLGGEKKCLYARDDNGRFTTAPSSGWEAEEVVLRQAIAEYDEARFEALSRVRQGLASPLEYHMYNRRMDITLLAQSTGICKWRVRRHLRPGVFRKLSDRVLGRYQQALDLTAAELQSFPEA